MMENRMETIGPNVGLGFKYAYRVACDPMTG